MKVDNLAVEIVLCYVVDGGIVVIARVTGCCVERGMAVKHGALHLLGHAFLNDSIRHFDDGLA